MVSFLGLDSAFKWAIFLTYMTLWTGLRIIIFGSQQTQKYNAAAVVLLTEMTKLVLATSMFVANDGTLGELAGACRLHWRTLVKYAVPAGLYCYYNNLTFTVLAVVNPSTYAILQNVRIIVTGLLYERMLNRKLSQLQWVAMVLLTIGCMVKEANQFGVGDASEKVTPLLMYGLILVQTFCAVFAGVYNEVLLKSDVQMSINLQNVFMYLNSIVANVVFMAIGMSNYTLADAVKWENIAPVLSPNVLSIVLCYALIGVVTSMVLKHLNSVLKTIAAALEIFLTAITSLAFFAIPIDSYTWIASVLVSLGVYIYSVYPYVAPAAPAARSPSAGPKDDENVV